MLNQARNDDCRFDVRLARNENEIRSAQRLRYDVFYEEMGARANPWKLHERRDADCYDLICDHLIVIDRQAADKSGNPLVVGTYRLTRRGVLRRNQKFFSESEFELEGVKNFPGEILELGRSCVHQNYRNRAVLDMLWHGLGSYIATHRIGILFGCASFPGIDPEQAADALTFLHHNHLAPENLRPRAHAGQFIEMRRRCESALDKRRALRQMPPLVRGYVGAGCMVGDGAVIDAAFNTLDVCVVLPLTQLSASYARRYQAAG